MMNKQELLEALEDTRQELVEMIENLPDSVLQEPGVSENWSIKDILAHLTHWEGQTVTLLYQAIQGIDKPTTVHFGEETMDALNARWYEQSRNRPLDMIWNDFIGVRKQTIRRIGEINEKDLLTAGRFPWMKGVALVEMVVTDTIEHEEEHADQIREWLDQRDARNNGADRH